MPWWQIRMFAEGLNEEFRDPNDDDEASPGKTNELDTADDLAAFGASVTVAGEPDADGPPEPAADTQNGPSEPARHTEPEMPEDLARALGITLHTTS